MKALAPGVLLLVAAACAAPSKTPAPFRQGSFPAPQTVTAVDVSDDGRLIAVATLAFRQDPNFWVLRADGEVVFGRNIAPWAPFQAAVLDGGKAFGAALAYSRVTSPLPTLSLFGGEKGEETVLEDSLGEWGWLRYGAGDWRTGWTASLLGDQLARNADSAVTMRGHNGALRLLADGKTEKYASAYERPFRMSVSTDGKAVACGYIVPEATSGLHSPPALVAVSSMSTAAELWKLPPTHAPPAIPELPRPAADFPELASRFRMEPDAVVPFRVAASVSAGNQGTRVAVTEYAGWLWVRKGPAIGGWNPPFHVIPFVPRQTGKLRIVTSDGTTDRSVDLPREGLFDVIQDPVRDRVWAVPMNWFARGMAGEGWLPTDPDSNAIYGYDRNGWIQKIGFQEDIHDAALSPDGGTFCISCRDGKIHFMRIDDRDVHSVEIGSVARVRWSRDGRFVIAGTDAGEVLCLAPDATIRWRVKLKSTAPPAEAPLKPVFEGVPVFSAGRVGKEHAYVGDIWFVKTAEGGFLVDAGGSSSLPFSLERIRAAGGDPATLKHLLQTHSHGDHAGAAYLWRARGLKIVAPESAAFALSWLMPMLTDYGVWVPRPVDVPLPLRKPGDEHEFMVAGQSIRAVFVPGHSMDSVIYLMILGGKRVAFTGDLGFQAPSDILHRCWGSVEHAAAVIDVVKSKVLPFRPDVVFTGHGGRPEGTAFLEDLVARSEESIRNARSK